VGSVALAAMAVVGRFRPPLAASSRLQRGLVLAERARESLVQLGTAHERGTPPGCVWTARLQLRAFEHTPQPTPLPLSWSACSLKVQDAVLVGLSSLLIGGALAVDCAALSISRVRLCQSPLVL
jgi:hypothetical protein